MPEIHMYMYIALFILSVSVSLLHNNFICIQYKKRSQFQDTAVVLQFHCVAPKAGRLSYSHKQDIGENFRFLIPNRIELKIKESLDHSFHFPVHNLLLRKHEL